jgi:hypothetical protein
MTTKRNKGQGVQEEKKGEVEAEDRNEVMKCVKN